jgi:carbamoyl-phosphate synthase large subunit
MRSTGESIGIDPYFPLAFLKAAEAAGFYLPQKGRVFVSLRDEDKPKVIPIVEKLAQMGFGFVATEGTAKYLNRHGFAVDTIGKVYKESKNILQDIKKGKVSLLINTPATQHEHKDAQTIRKVAFLYRVPFYTTIPSASAAVNAIEMKQRIAPSIHCLQDIHIA